MKKNNAWKLIVDKTPLKGSFNMAADEYLFLSLGEDSQTYLRFYQWEKPTVSLGYSQNIEKVVNLDYCREKSIDIVRRITGGKLVLHHLEITYSLCSSDDKIFPPMLSDSYRLISQALILGLKKMGVNSYLAAEAPTSYIKGNLPCFSYPARNEIKVQGKKIVGSAQKRHGSHFIQHGSIPVENNGDLLESITNLKGGKSNIRMTSLSEVLGRRVSFEWAVASLAEGFSEYFGISLKQKILKAREKEIISKIQKRRYENKDWTFSRKES